MTDIADILDLYETSTPAADRAWRELVVAAAGLGAAWGRFQSALDAYGEAKRSAAAGTSECMTPTLSPAGLDVQRVVTAENIPFSAAVRDRDVIGVHSQPRQYQHKNTAGVNWWPPTAIRCERAERHVATLGPQQGAIKP